MLERLLTPFRRSNDSTDDRSYGIWEQTTNLVGNDAVEPSEGWQRETLGPDQGWFAAKIPGRAFFGSGPMTLTLGIVNTIAAGGEDAVPVLDDEQLRARAREYVERGATADATVLSDEAISRFFAYCDEYREQGRTVAVLTEPVRVGLRKLAAGTECEVLASWTDGRSRLRHGKHEFVVYHAQHYCRWRWNDER